MKPLIPALLMLSFAPLLLPGQDLPVNPGDAAATTARYSREELKQMVGQIALYPDPLVGLILPASTFPGDIVLAARFVESGEDLSHVDQQPWDVSIRALTRYPDVLKWMNDNLVWTTQLGQAYLAQPNDVMDAIQELRNKAQKVGNLVDTRQQRIVREDRYIRIVPAEPDYVYAPYYDPLVVYDQYPTDVPFLTFGSPWLTGWWLSFDFDWGRHRLYCGDWNGGWDYNYGYDRYDDYGDRVYINDNFTNYQVWEGDPARRVNSDRFLSDSVYRSSALATPQRFQEQPQLASRVQKTLAKQDKRWAKGAVSSGLADNSLVKAKGNRGKDGKGLLETTQSQTPNVSDALVGKGRKDADSQGVLDSKSGKGKKDQLAIPKAEAPVVTPGIADEQSVKGAKGNKDKVVTPKSAAPKVADSQGVLDSKGAKGNKDKVVTPKSAAPKLADSKGKKGSPGIDSAAPQAIDVDKGKGSSKAPKPSAGPDVSNVSPQSSPGPTVKKSAPKQKAVASAPKKSSGSPATKMSSSKPKAVASKPQSAPKQKAIASAPKKSNGPPAMKLSSSKPKAVASKPQSVPKPQAAKVSAAKPSGGGGNKAAASTTSSDDKKKKKK